MVSLYRCSFTYNFDNLSQTHFLLIQPLARLGAFVIGVEASEENIKIAQAHLMYDPAIAPNVKYIHATVEDLVGTEEGKMDAVVASEVVEHVADAPAFLSSCCRLVKVGCVVGSNTMLYLVCSPVTDLSR